ncbi:esterase FE4 [Calliopsis andreniformis]|uniref:esterase FE4 n=1 Tax=Calliopsis andreniformis TaxID=337506 RepID=UPI003FCECFB4
MNKPIVSVKDGKLQGAEVKSVLGPSFVAFYDIPFAAPPLGELRFKDPQPAEPWKGVKDVSQSANRVAIQIDELPPKEIVGSEDCLYLNVYTTSLSGCKPVMFWIHGGAYIVGTASSKIKKPDYLMTKDVVVVAANYRLGALGFLNLGHRAAPGNMAVKDLILALEWVKDNIASFGGDPCNVTIFGASAGGSLCHTLIVSPLARGLVHKAILQSGSLTCGWAENSSPEFSFRLAKVLGNDSIDPEEIVEFLRQLPAKDIIKAQSEVCSKEEEGRYMLTFGIACDKVAENPVLPYPIEQMLSKDCDIPVVIGSTSDEFIMFFRDTSEQTLKAFNYFLPTYVKALQVLGKKYDLDYETSLKIVKERYLCGKSSVTLDNIGSFTRFMSDVYFGLPARLIAEDRVQRGAKPTFFYSYNYVGNERTHTDVLVERQVRGASHVDELSYLFYIPVFKTDNPDPPAEGTKDRLMIERMIALWTNFARTGNPTPCDDKSIETIWKPATKDKLYCFKIDDKLECLPAEPNILNSKCTLSSSTR